MVISYERLKFRHALSEGGDQGLAQKTTPFERPLCTYAHKKQSRQENKLE